MIDTHALSWRFIKVWRRNAVTFQKTWKVSFITPLLEPFFFVAAFGLGFAGLVGSVRYGGSEFSYTAFIAPALIATAVMNNAFFETTYASFVRMYYQKTFDGMLATPLSIEEIIIAEIVWSATKSAAAAAIMLGVLSAFGYILLPSGLLVIPLAFFGGIAFGAIGLFFTGIIPTIEMFNLPIFLFVTPMFLFSGTFFRSPTCRCGPSPWRSLFHFTTWSSSLGCSVLGGMKRCLCSASPTSLFLRFFLRHWR